MGLRQLPNSRREPLRGAKRLGPAATDERVSVTIVVRRRRQLRRNAPGPLGRPTTKEQRIALRHRFAAEYGADPSDLHAVALFANRAGMSDIQVNAARRTVTAHGTVEQMNAAFGVSLGRYRARRMTYRGREDALSIPRELHGVIEAVLGLDNRPQARPHHRVGGMRGRARLGDPARAPRGRPGPLWAAQVARLYDFPTGYDGSGETIALIQLGGGVGIEDVEAYFRRARSSVPSISIVEVGIGRNEPGVDRDADTEVLLDIDIAGSVAPGADLVVYFSDLSDQGFFNAVSTAIHDIENAPSIVSISWGDPEAAWTEQGRSVMDAALADAAALGVTVVCAAGDHGSSDGVPDGQVHCDFPGSSPNALTCGGTTLVGGARGIVSEVVWNDWDGWATGGGISDGFAVPAWQRALPMPPHREGGRKGRGVPDVAGNADKRTGYWVRVRGRWRKVGGTSAVAPLYAGLVALMNQALGRPLGAFTPRLYRLPPADGLSAFHDVTDGHNGVPAIPPGPAVAGYRAAKGWDACTGLGSIRGSALLEALRPRPRTKAHSPVHANSPRQ